MKKKIAVIALTLTTLFGGVVIAAPAEAAPTAVVAPAQAAPEGYTAVTVNLADLSQGGSGTFYYGPYNTATVCGFYGQATNYNYGTGQQYHWAFKSLDAGYTTNSITFGGSGGKTISTGGAKEGYTNFSSTYKSVDYTMTFYVKNGSGPCSSYLNNSWQ